MLTGDFVFTQGIVIAGRIDVDDIAAAGIFEDGPVAVECVLSDRGKPEMTELSAGFRSMPCRQELIRLQQ